MASTWPDENRLADKIRGSVSLPVDVFDVARRTRVEVLFHESATEPEGYAELSRPERVYLRKNGSESPGTMKRQRFTLAHELGHVILHREIGAVPSESDYWMHEDWCQRFAAALLLPSTSIRQLLPPPSELSWMPYLFLPAKLSNLGQVSIEVASRALVQTPGFQFDFLRIKKKDDGRMRVEMSTFGSPKIIGIRAILKAGEISTKMSEMEVGSVLRITWTTTLGKLKLLDRESLVYRGMNDWFVMIRRPGPKTHWDGEQLAFSEK